MKGLSSAEAAARLAAEGPNALPVPGRHGLAAIALRVLREPMFLLLIAATGIYLLLGDVHEAIVLGASIAGVIAITVTQERKAERALEALRDLSSPRAMVLRDGDRRRIAGRDVVRGDLLILAEGDRIPAAAVFAAYGWALDSGRPEAAARTIAFAAIVFSNLALPFATRSRTRTVLVTLREPNAALWVITLGALAALAAAIYVPAAAGIFRFAPLGAAELGVAAGAALAGVAWVEVLKLTGRAR